MDNLFQASLFAGVTVSLVAYLLGMLLKKKFKLAILNPLLISIVMTIIVLVVADVDYDTYNKGASYLSWFLTPATVCLAIPLYEQWTLLKKNIAAVALGLTAGVITSLVTVLVLSVLMGLSHEDYVTLLPKSITTAIGMGVSEELGGYVTITVAVIVVTGVLGNILGEFVCKIFRITEPISKGLALGASSHAIGTAKAIEIGEIEGAMSSLAIAVAGILTVVFASCLQTFIDLSERFLRVGFFTERSYIYMIITIARKCGCDADTIGRAVAEKYHLHFMDREAIATGAKEAGCYDEYEEFYSERPVNSLLYSIVMETEEDNVLHDTPARALTFIDRLPLEDGCEGYVIQGRCANFAFQGRDDVVSVFLTANDAFCVDTVADTHGVSVRKAKTVVRETNDNRKTYHKYYTGQEWGQAENYDLCLNVAKLGVDGVIAMIDSFIQNRK